MISLHLILEFAIEVIKKLATTAAVGRLKEWWGRVCKNQEEVFETFAPEASIAEQARERRFRTFDLCFDLPSILSLLKSPRAFVLIEDRPSTAYCLPLVVLADEASTEWYVFRRGRIAFEGCGGGMSNSKAIFGHLRANGVSLSAWVLPRSSADDLEIGFVTWPQVREQAIPVASVPYDGAISLEIQRNASTLLSLPAFGAS